MTKYYATIFFNPSHITITKEEDTEFSPLGVKESDYQVVEIPHKIVSEIMMCALTQQDEELGFYK